MRSWGGKGSRGDGENLIFGFYLRDDMFSDKYHKTAIIGHNVAGLDERDDELQPANSNSTVVMHDEWLEIEVA